MYQTEIAKASKELREAVKNLRDALDSIVAAGKGGPLIAGKAAVERYDRAVIALDRARSGG